MEFKKLKTAVAAQFGKISKHDLFCTAVTKEEMWQTYLTSFPLGTNPIFRQRTEHDCSCCRSFIGTVGNVVALIGEEKVSIWRCITHEPAYQTVVDALAGLVESQPITGPFLTPNRTAGVDKNFEQLLDGVQTWEHFFIHIPTKFVKHSAEIGPALSDAQATHDVLLRGLQEITPDAITTTLEIIDQGSLYRGEEHRANVKAFGELQTKFVGLATNAERDIFVWQNVTKLAAVTRIRNTAIGTLLIDLSEDVDLETAVKSFEVKVAPTNYKRPKALITKAMIEQAKAKVQELGLTSALERRFATLTDLNINDLLFVDRQIRAGVNRDIFGDLAARTTPTKKGLSATQEVPIAKFIQDILPHVREMEVLLENRQAGNLVALIAPTDPTAPGLFKWPNGISWSYNGEVADSIRERVKRAGGSVEGDLCCRLSWFNTDDLDLHMVEPRGNEVFYGAKVSRTTGGRLDVDMNVRGETREPVENIFYHSKDKMAEGVYRLLVYNYYKREIRDVGFEVEIDVTGTLYHFTYDQAVANKTYIPVADIVYSHKNGFTVKGHLPHSQASQQIWGLTTGTFHRVSTMMLSPNYWTGQTGNKHFFFMLDSCAADGPVRSFYNEFLRSDLDVHRKVFEVVGSKLKPAETGEQLCGLGFSSTKQDSLIVRTKGNFTRTIKITF